MHIMNILFSLCFGSSFKYLEYLSQLGQGGNPYPSNGNANKHVAHWFDIYCYVLFRPGAAVNQQHSGTLCLRKITRRVYLKQAERRTIVQSAE